jgi:hypothetical protein
MDDAVEVLLHEALVLGHSARIPDHHGQLEERQQFEISVAGARKE